MNFSAVTSCLVAFASVSLAACSENSSGSDSADGGAGAGSGGTGGLAAECAALSPSGLVRFEIGEETLLVGTQDAAFIDEATRLLEAGETRVPVFNQLVDGTGCDAQWSWHPGPGDMEFADFTIELCDGTPSYIEENKVEWFATVERYCPWSAVVTEVSAVDPR
jgi:hypothetical protein